MRESGRDHAGNRPGPTGGGFTGPWPQTAEEFEKLVDLCREALLNYACRRVRDRHATEDLVQQVFLKAFRVRRENQGVTKVVPYLYRMLQNAIIDRARAGGPRPAPAAGWR